MTQFDLTVGVLFLILGGLALYASVTLLRVHHTAAQQIRDLHVSLTKEQRLTTHLRDELSRRGVETIIEPEAEGYAVTFRSHAPRLGTPASVQPWRGPMGRA